MMTALMFIFTRQMYFVSKLTLILSVFLMSIAFLAGWLHINKLAVKSYNPNDVQEIVTQKTVDNFKQFFVGVGNNFVKTFFGFLLSCVIYSGSFYLLTKYCVATYGEPNILIEMSKLSQMQTHAELLSYLNGVSEADKLAFVGWIWSFVFLTSIMNYLFILYFAVLNFEDKNIFVALLKTIKFFILNIFVGLVIMIVMFLFYLVLNMLSFLFGTGSISFVILIILFVLYLNYYVLLVFYFYYGRTKINSDSRSE